MKRDTEGELETPVTCRSLGAVSRWFTQILLWFCPSGLRIAFLGTISKLASFEKFTTFGGGVGGDQALLQTNLELLIPIPPPSSATAP